VAAQARPNQLLNQQQIALAALIHVKTALRHCLNNGGHLRARVWREQTLVARNDQGKEALSWDLLRNSNLLLPAQEDDLASDIASQVERTLSLALLVDPRGCIGAF
jgi:hypothetical protein